MLGFLLQLSLALSLVKLHLEGLNGVSTLLEHMQRRLTVVETYSSIRLVRLSIIRNCFTVHGDEFLNCVFFP